MGDRPTILDRYERLTERSDELAKMALGVHPTEVHRAAVEALTDLLGMATTYGGPKVPAPLRAMVRTLDRMQPVLIEEIAKVPPDQIRAFMGELAAKMQAIADTGTVPERGPDSAVADQPAGA